MEILKWVLLGVQSLSAVLLIVFVLLHSPKGSGLANLGGATQMFASQKGVEATLNKLTAYTAGTFFVVSFILGYYLS
jgi:preprotein translocase subunit SecG